MTNCIPILEKEECRLLGTVCKCVPNEELIIAIVVGLFVVGIVALIVVAIQQSAKSARNPNTKLHDKTLRKTITVSPKHKEKVSLLAKDVFLSSGWHILDSSTSKLTFEKGSPWSGGEDQPRVATLIIKELGKKLTLNLHVARPDKWYLRGHTLKQNEVSEVEKNFNKLLLEISEIKQSRKRS